MKTLKIYNDIHTSIKVEAAKSGRPTTNVGSELLRHALKLVKSGKLKIDNLPQEESSPTK